MKNLKPSEIEFLHKYQDLLESMEEAFSYLHSMADVESDIAHTIFADLVKASQQLHLCHGQLTGLIQLDDFTPFDGFVENMAKWFQDDEDKDTLLADYLIPAFQSWKNIMDKQIQPYVLQ